MSNLDQIIDFTKLSQDVELATAIGQLKTDPAQLQQFLQSQQTKVYTDVIKQKDSTFQKVYGDLNRASQAQEATLMYDKRNKDFAAIQQEILDNEMKSASALTFDKDISNRKYEMNQWSINDKKETLFIFSMIFIVLSALVLFTVLWRLGTISSSLWVGLSAPLIIILVLTIIVRSQYTNVFRDKRYWNRRTFGEKYGKIPIPICPGSLTALEQDVSSIQGGISSAISSAEQSVASAAQTAAQDVSSAAQSVANTASSYTKPSA